MHLPGVFGKDTWEDGIQTGLGKQRPREANSQERQGHSRLRPSSESTAGSRDKV